MMSRRWIYILLIIIAAIVLYGVLGWLGVVPTYQCPTIMIEGGPARFCGWYYGYAIY
jgi:hypothetical protein